MSKPQRRVFNPVRIDTDIGDGNYILEPQPLARILEFDDVVSELSTQFDDLVDEFYVTDDETGDDIAGPFQNYDGAQAFIDGAEDRDGKSVRSEGVSVREILDRLISSPYVVLKPLIPDLQEEHVRQVSFPQLKHIFGLLVEVNGLEWLEAMSKNVLEPLLPRLADLTAGAFLSGARGALNVFTETQEEMAGETPSTES